MRLLDKIKSFGHLLFPWWSLLRANRKIKTKINKIENGDFETNLDYMRGYKLLSLDEVNSFFEKTLQVKKSLEDKLKTSLFSVTLGITVLTSTLSFLFSDGVSYFSKVHRGIVVFTGSAAIVYMILAGIFAIKTISGAISVYQPFPEDIANKTDENKKELIAVCAELNSLSNIIRQNFMTVSFHCIINSLFIVVLFFL